MGTRTSTKTTTRNKRLRAILVGRRRELQEDVQRRILDQRTDRPHDVHDELDRTDGDLANEVELVLIQMKAETLKSIDTALSRLEAGEYGRCLECDVEISETRLGALPFAVRCKTCEEAREQGQAQTRRATQQYESVSRFSATVSVS